VVKLNCLRHLTLIVRSNSSSTVAGVAGTPETWVKCVTNFILHVIIPLENPYWAVSVQYKLKALLVESKY